MNTVRMEKYKKQNFQQKVKNNNAIQSIQNVKEIIIKWNKIKLC